MTENICHTTFFCNGECCKNTYIKDEQNPNSVADFLQTWPNAVEVENFSQLRNLNIEGIYYTKTINGIIGRIIGNCPFLKNGSCSNYNNRHSACRAVSPGDAICQKHLWK